MLLLLSAHHPLTLLLFALCGVRAAKEGRRRRKEWPELDAEREEPGGREHSLRCWHLEKEKEKKD